MGGSHWRRAPYPSQSNFLRRHSLQRGWVSSHLTFRSRHVQHPVNVLVRFFDGAVRVELADICAPEIGLFRCDIGRSLYQAIVHQTRLRRLRDESKGNPGRKVKTWSIRTSNTCSECDALLRSGFPSSMQGQARAPSASVLAYLLIRTSITCRLVLASVSADQVRNEARGNSLRYE